MENIQQQAISSEVPASTTVVTDSSFLQVPPQTDNVQNASAAPVANVIQPGISNRVSASPGLPNNVSFVKLLPQNANPMNASVSNVVLQPGIANGVSSNPSAARKIKYVMLPPPQRTAVENGATPRSAANTVLQPSIPNRVPISPSALKNLRFVRLPLQNAGVQNGAAPRPATNMVLRPSIANGIPISPSVLKNLQFVRLPTQSPTGEGCQFPIFRTPGTSVRIANPVSAEALGFPHLQPSASRTTPDQRTPAPCIRRILLPPPNRNAAIITPQLNRNSAIITPQQNRNSAIITPQQNRNSDVITVRQRTKSGVKKQALKSPATFRRKKDFSYPPPSSGSTKDDEKKRNFSAAGLDEDIIDVSVMAGINLEEESLNLLQSKPDSVETESRSCEEENLLRRASLKQRILKIAAKHGLKDATDEATMLIQQSVETKLKDLIEKSRAIAEHRLDSVKSNSEYEVCDDVKSQLKFLKDLDRLQQKRRQEEERNMILQAAKKKSKTNDPEHLEAERKAKEIIQSETDDLRLKAMNMTALHALQPRKKPKTDLSSSDQSQEDNTNVMRRRVKRVNMRDFQLVMEQEEDTYLKEFLFKSYLK